MYLASCFPHQVASHFGIHTDRSSRVQKSGFLSLQYSGSTRIVAAPFRRVGTMSTPTSIRALSKLPRELRDEIYAEVLDFSTSPPKSPTDEAVSESDQREEDQGWGVIYYQRHFPSTNLAGLLGCNHQIRDEVLDLIKVEAGGIAYSVDLMIWENSIQPTWMELPTPPKYTKQLNVTLRMFSHTGPQWGESGILGQYLLQMLRRFLYDGPSFATDPPGRRDSRPLYPLHLEELTIVLEAMKTKVDDKT